jgi:hypothetical protein
MNLFNDLRAITMTKKEAYISMHSFSHSYIFDKIFIFLYRFRYVKFVYFVHRFASKTSLIKLFIVLNFDVELALVVFRDSAFFPTQLKDNILFLFLFFEFNANYF